MLVAVAPTRSVSLVISDMERLASGQARMLSDPGHTVGGLSGDCSAPVTGGSLHVPPCGTRPSRVTPSPLE
ncbi:hypothetical protein SGFS_032250 [Streptomyces graminofaciens]|uniref:Uncharacterized protein n=1 Tax=Streptomyces graminofaciens TaxID=68212 RepID=A0ABN5VFD3_9ACTN|nr:hypothetical protein SGFS_032250 [Streptomyces graminofaciens]